MRAAVVRRQHAGESDHPPFPRIEKVKAEKVVGRSAPRANFAPVLAAVRRHEDLAAVCRSETVLRIEEVKRLDVQSVRRRRDDAAAELPALAAVARPPDQTTGDVIAATGDPSVKRIGEEHVAKIRRRSERKRAPRVIARAASGKCECEEYGQAAFHGVAIPYIGCERRRYRSSLATPLCSAESKISCTLRSISAETRCCSSFTFSCIALTFACSALTPACSAFTSACLRFTRS